MATIVIKLDPAHLDNPDLDLRYALPELLAQISDGAIRDNGYDYSGTPAAMLLFLLTDDLERATQCVIEVITKVQVLENDLSRAAVVAVERDGKFDVIHPSGWTGEFPADLQGR